MRVLTAVCTAAILVGGVAAGAGASTDPASGVACASEDGRDRLTPNGFAQTFEAPVVAAPELRATRDVTGETVTTFREAKFPFVVDLAPAAAAKLDLELGWKRTSDYDLYVLGPDGSELAASAESNVESGVPAEAIAGLTVRHCDQLTVVVRNWAGVPAQELNLGVSVTPGSSLLACMENDPAAGCLGKAAGEAPDAVVDTRTRLFLGGDPGQASMVWARAGDPSLPQGRLTADRPKVGVPNSYTRPVVGFRDQLRNPFVPHFTGTLAEPRALAGTADALVWVSSPTLRDGGTLVVDLYVDDSMVGSVPVPGALVGTAPTPVRVQFPNLNVRKASAVTLQLGTTPAVSSTGPGNPADAVFTVHYGSVQFPSRLTLP
jgi:hypothetical protein